MISVEKNETISVKPKKTQSNRKNAVEHAGDARSQTKRTPNLRRKKRQIAVDSSEILHNWTAILRFVENSTEILLSGLSIVPSSMRILIEFFFAFLCRGELNPPIPPRKGDYRGSIEPGLGRRQPTPAAALVLLM
eukprot:scaffold8530_cov121-Isochrysis_galbana.AAC.7